jgi:hypothetical protein
MRVLRARRGSALILVLLMTLAVAALAIAAIFMSSSAGLLSRFYDREREYRLAAEAALAIVRSRLEHSQTLAVPDTGMRVLASGLQIANSSGAVDTRISVNVYAAATGDTTGRWLPHVTLIAAAYDAGGTRHVRRLDLQRQSYSRYAMVVDSFPSGMTFGPATVNGPVHANDAWRTGTSAATAGVYRDSLTATGGFSGTATYTGDTSSAVPTMPYPRDSTFAWMTTLASAANLSFAPVSGSGAGYVQGSRLEFVTFDADGDGTVEVGESYARIFDLGPGADTSRLRVSIDPSTWFILYYAKYWTDRIIQNQCGAFYYRSSRWQFFPVATHRSSWARAIIQQTGGSNFPSVTNPTMNEMDDYDFNAVSLILSQSTARCFPTGSPYLMPTERMTNDLGVITGTDADTVPFGVVAGTGYGGNDTTFTARARSCQLSTGGTTGRCDTDTHATIGSWRSFPGTPVSGIATTVRQAAELPRLWPLNAPSNSASRGVMRATGGPLFVSGTVRGDLTLVVDGDVVIVESLTYANNPADPATDECTDQLGIVAVGDVLVADNALLRARRIGNTFLSSMTKHLGPSRDITVHGHLMSLTGTVGVENPAATAPSGLECPQTGGSANSAAGCFLHTGAAIMQTYTPLWNGSTTGMRYAGSVDRCQATTRRPPFFPLTNRYSTVRALEIQPALANTPTKIRTLLLRLKGKSL